MRLLLLRHAKSAWSVGKAIDDHDRPLNRRGRLAAPLMASYMRDKGWVPDIVLCSTAMRTRETLDLALPFFAPRPTVRYVRALYLAEWPVLLNAIRALPQTNKAALLIGHNPGMEQLAVALALHPKTTAERARSEALAEKFPTAALAVLEFEGPEWHAVRPGEGRLLDYVRPKELQPDDGHEE